MERFGSLVGTLALIGAVLSIVSARSGQSGSSSPPSEARRAAHSDSPWGTESASPAPANGVLAALLEAIRASSPPDWHFSLDGDRLDGDWRLDGHVDDGSGPGRLLVDVTIRPGMLVAHPCADPEFRQGARCVDRRLPDGDLLALRDIVVDPGGMETIDAVLIHPDGSGIGAEAGNWTIDGLANGTPVPETGLSVPRVTRPRPLYTVDRLARLLRAVDERARHCINVGC
jgi:hypothetical protein